MLPAKNNVYGVLAAPISDTDTSIPLLDASKFPISGIAVLAGGVDPYTNEIVLYTGKSGETLTGCTRGFDGTAAESHPASAFVGLAIIAKHITDLQPKHGTTSARNALAGTLTVDDTGRRFYDIDEDELYSWVNDRWEKATVSIGRGVRDYYGTAAEILPLDYRAGDRWTLSVAPYTLQVCRATVITNTLADWIAAGRQN